MSTIKADNFVDLSREVAGTTPYTIGSEYIVEGAAKAWGHFEGSDATLDDSFGMSSLTDNGVGDFTPNLSSSMANADYAFVSGCFTNIISTSCSGSDAGTYAVGSCNLRTSSAGALSDRDDTTFSVLGELA